MSHQDINMLMMLIDQYSRITDEEIKIELKKYIRIMLAQLNGDK
jgi:hypothetical protein